MDEPSQPRSLLGIFSEPQRGPKVLMKSRSWSSEVFYRFMYLVFLFYAGVVIALGLLCGLSFVLQVLTMNLRVDSWLFISGGVGLLLLLGVVRDFWVRKFDLYRMDDNFCGIAYLEDHLRSPSWSKAKELLDLLESPSFGAIEREEFRRQLALIARDCPSIYEAVYELGDDRLRWTLVHACL